MLRICSKCGSEYDPDDPDEQHDVETSERVWVACVSHKHGAVAFVDRTDTGLRAQLAAYCRAEWGRIDTDGDGVRPQPPEDDAGCVAQYFDAATYWNDPDTLEFFGEVEVEDEDHA